jgi:hypothetical protein
MSHRSDEFVEAQSKMLRSASDYRLQERKIAEAWCDAIHIPTRSEMDEVQRTVTELRRQLRALQRGALGARCQDAATSHARQRSGRSARPRRSRVRTRALGASMTAKKPRRRALAEFSDFT